MADCDSGDTFRIRAYDTTYRMARFNNSATQITVVVIANPTDQTVTGNLWFYAASTGTAGGDPGRDDPGQGDVRAQHIGGRARAPVRRPSRTTPPSAL